MEIIFLILLIIVNGLFAMSEIALVTARRARLTRLAEAGDTAAAVAISLGTDPTRFLSTIQIGITSIGLLNGIVGEAALAKPIAIWLTTQGLPTRSSELGATIFAVITITYLSIVIGELVPKRIGQMNPEAIARLVARPMHILAFISRPFVVLLSWSTNTILHLLGKHSKNTPGVTQEEIHAILEEGSEAGIIEKNEHDMLRNVFRLDDRQISSLMIPRADIVWLDLNLPLATNLGQIAESEHSRFPVCRGGLDHIVGIIATKQMFNQTLRGKDIDLAAQLHPVVYVPESLNGMELLDQFRTSGTHMVFVIDEYGEVLGLITLQDVLEALTGEFPSHNLDDAWAIQREDGTWLLDGLIPLPELKDHLGLKTVPEEHKGRYHTLSGMILWLLGRLPQTGDVTVWEDWQLEVVDMDGKRIDKILASPLQSGIPSPSDEKSAPAHPD